MGADPVELGLVDSFNRPGGNATEFTILTTQLEPKRIGLLRELVPTIPLMGALLGPNVPQTGRQLREIEEATRKIGQRLFVARAGNDTELDAAFRSLIEQRVGAMLVAATVYFDTTRERIIALAAGSKIPAMYHLREYAVAGGLISYGPRITDAYHQAGVYVGRILRGAKPADLPVLQASRFELVINMKTANALEHHAARRHRRIAGRRRKSAARGPRRDCPAARGGDTRSPRLLDGGDWGGRYRSGRGGAARRHVRECRAILAGPGMMDYEAAAALAAALLREAGHLPIVLDAAALAGLSQVGWSFGGRERAVITPHPGEMARLLDVDVADIEADPLASARQAANRFGVVAVLKSARTHIVGRDGEAFHLDEGDIGLATAGSGDVLAGIVAGLLARGASPLAASLWVFIFTAKPAPGSRATSGSSAISRANCWRKSRAC